MAKQRLTFINEEDLPDSFFDGQPRKTKVHLISQGSHGTATTYPDINTDKSYYLFHKNPAVNETYGVKILIKEEKHPDTIINTDIAIKFFHEDNNSYYAIEHKNIYLNNDYLNNTLFELSKDCRMTFTPLFVTCNDFTIGKFDTYQNKWNDIKKDVENKYQGDVSTTYIKAFEQTLKNKKSINRILTEDMFLPIFKHVTINRAFDKQLKSKSILRFPIMPNVGGVCFTLEQNILAYTTDFNCYKITSHGKISDSRSLNNLISQSFLQTVKSSTDPSAQGDCVINFYLNKETGILMYCDATFQIQLDKTIKIIDIKINKIKNQ